MIGLGQPGLAFLHGFGLGAGLIVAIGAQNAFVLRQGLLRSYRLLVAALCTLIDAALILLGAAGFGGLVAHLPLLTRGAAWLGAAFLFAYGARSFVSALRPQTLREAPAEAKTPGAVAATTLALSLLNPHVYLDTVVLVGGLAAQYAWPVRLWFAGGAMLASLLWFFGLAFGASFLSPLFRRPLTWRVLDILIGGIMWAIAISLLRPTH